MHGHRDRDTSPVPQTAKNQPQIKSSFIKASPNLPLSEREAGFGDHRGTSSLDGAGRAPLCSAGWGMIVKRKHFMF